MFFKDTIPELRVWASLVERPRLSAWLSSALSLWVSNAWGRGTVGCRDYR